MQLEWADKCSNITAQPVAGLRAFHAQKIIGLNHFSDRTPMVHAGIIKMNRDRTVQNIFSLSTFSTIYSSKLGYP